MKEENDMRLLQGWHKPVAASALLLALAGCAPSQYAGLADSAAASTATSAAQGGLSRTTEIAQLQVDAARVYAQLIEYFATGEEAASEQPAGQPPAPQRLEAFLRFAPGSTQLVPAYGNNHSELARIRRELAAPTAGGTMQIASIRISGFASPDGHTHRNEELAMARALRYRSHLERELPPEMKGVVEVERSAEDWDGLCRLAAETGKPYAARVAALVDSVTNPDERRKALRALDKGSVWKDMEKTLFGRLRRLQIDVDYCPTEAPAVVAAPKTNPETPGLAELVKLFDADPDGMKLNELTTLATAYRPGTEQYREVYELAAYRFPNDATAQLNAAAASLALGDIEAAHYFLSRVANDPRASINRGVLALMEGDETTAADCFRQAKPRNPRLAREGMRLITNY